MPNCCEKRLRQTREHDYIRVWIDYMRMNSPEEEIFLMFKVCQGNLTSKFGLNWKIWGKYVSVRCVCIKVLILYIHMNVPDNVTILFLIKNTRRIYFGLWFWSAFVQCCSVKHGLRGYRWGHAKRSCRESLDS